MTPDRSWVRDSLFSACFTSAPRRKLCLPEVKATVSCAIYVLVMPLESCHAPMLKSPLSSTTGICGKPSAEVIPTCEAWTGSPAVCLPKKRVYPSRAMLTNLDVVCVSDNIAITLSFSTVFGQPGRLVAKPMKGATCGARDSKNLADNWSREEK